MADITNPANIPVAFRPSIAAAIEDRGQDLLGDRWPATYDPANLTNAQLANVFELLTRDFWRRLAADARMAQQLEATRLAVLAAQAADPFAP